MTPKISVIVPVYRVEPYLRKCLDSIASQSYRNLEILLVDDGSPDSCGAICDAYAAQDERIRVIHKPNGGAASARNAGLAEATGEWIGWVDSDDWIEPDMFAYLLGLALEHHADMVQCGIFFEDRGRAELQFVPDHLTIVQRSADELETKHLEMLSNSNYTKLYRAEKLRGLTFDTTYPIGEDLLFNLYALTRISCVVFAPQAKYHYIQRESSLCNASPSAEQLVSYRRMLERAEKTFERYPAFQEFLQKKRLINNLDMCSKIVRYNLKWSAQWEQEIRMEMRKNVRYVLASRQFDWQEKLKYAIIAFCWPIYRTSLTVWKHVSVRRLYS